MLFVVVGCQAVMHINWVASLLSVSLFFLAIALTHHSLTVSPPCTKGWTIIWVGSLQQKQPIILRISTKNWNGCLKYFWEPLYVWWVMTLFTVFMTQTGIMQTLLRSKQEVKKKQQIILLNIHLKTSILQYFTVGYREDLNLDGPHPLLGWKKSWHEISAVGPYQCCDQNYTLVQKSSSVVSFHLLPVFVVFVMFICSFEWRMKRCLAVFSHLKCQ